MNIDANCLAEHSFQRLDKRYTAADLNLHCTHYIRGYGCKQDTEAAKKQQSKATKRMQLAIDKQTEHQ